MPRALLPCAWPWGRSTRNSWVGRAELQHIVIFDGPDRFFRSLGLYNMRDFTIKIINMAQTNTEAVFEYARQLASAQAPSDFADVLRAQARKQFEMLREQTRELTALGQKMPGESGAPIAHKVKQAF